MQRQCGSAIIPTLRIWIPHVFKEAQIESLYRIGIPFLHNPKENRLQGLIKFNIRKKGVWIMVKKILLVSAIAALTSAHVAMANPSPYIGGGIGITNNSSTVKINDGDNYAGGSFRGVPVNLFAGYGGNVNENFYLAGEVFGTVGTFNLTKNNSGLKTDYTYGAAIIPGVMLSEQTLAYGRVGILKSHFPDASSNNRAGAQFGAGLQTTLAQNIDLRGEYDYIAYKSTTARSGGNKFTFSPRADQFNVGLVYKFD